MTTPWLPLYLGSYDELFKKLLRDPLLASGRLGPPWRATTDDAPVQLESLRWHKPESKQEVIVAFVNAVAAKETAAAMPAGSAKTALDDSAEKSIRALIDDYCGTRPVGPPLPYPVPWIYGFEIATALVWVANGFPDSDMRNSLISVAGRLAERTYAAGQVG